MSPSWTAIDLVTAALGAATLVLTGVAVIVAIGAWIGYRNIRRASVQAAETEARRIAEEIAAREMRAFLDKHVEGPDISQGYRDEPSP